MSHGNCKVTGNIVHMHQCSGWIYKFLIMRSLDFADQRILYKYHCTSDEYHELREMLRDLGSFDKAIKSVEACACFVLFTAEWYRREYKRDHGWSWDPVFDELGYELNSLVRDKVVPTGMNNFWRRPIHKFDSDRRDFLGSIFGEGGLPFQVLRETGSPFQTLLDRLIKQNKRVQLLGHTTLDQVKMEVERINMPQAFSRLASVQLFTDMVTQLVSLVRDYELEEADDPVSKLDTSNPRWREMFPLPLDSQTGSELLNGLLKSASIEGKRQREKAGGWLCVHRWSERDPDVLQVELSTPKKVSFALAAHPDSARFDLTIMEDEQVIANLGPGFARITESVAEVNLRQSSFVVPRKNPAAMLSLAASVGGAVISKLSIKKSSVLLGEVPLGFASEDGRWVLCGQASFNTKSEDIILVLPEDCTAERVSATESSVPLEEVATKVCGLRTVKLQGVAEAEMVDDEHYRVRTGNTYNADLNFDLVGKFTGWTTKPVLTFVGLPEIPEVLKRTGVDLFINGERPNAVQLQEVLGAQFASMRNKNGTALMRRKVGILPTDFKLELAAGVAPGTVMLTIHTQRPCIFTIADQSIDVHRVKKPGITELFLTADSVPPVTFTLEVTPSLVSDPVTFELPFPSAGCLLFDGTGQQITRDLRVDQLLGTRLFLFGPVGHTTRFDIEMSLRGHATKNAGYNWTYTVLDHPVEVSMFSLREQIEDLLSLQDGIDQVVQMNVRGNGRNIQFLLRRHSAMMRYDGDFKRIALDRETVEDGIYPKPAILLLHEPSRAAIPLMECLSEGVPTGDFEIPEEVADDGPWLVVPEKDSPVTFRAFFLPGNWVKPDGTSTEVIDTLQQAVIAFHPSQNSCPFKPVLEAMASNPHHSGWEFLQNLYNSFSYLPMPVFEVWRVLVRHSEALSMMLFKFRMDETFISRLESEFGVFKEFLSVAAVKRASEHYVKYLVDTDVEHDAALRSVDRMIRRMGMSFPAYGNNVLAYLAGKPMGRDAQMAPQLLRIVQEGWYQELIREHCDGHWSEYGSKELERWHQKLAVPTITIPTDMSYRNAVIYLPVFAAAVAAGNAKIGDLFNPSGETIFFLRQVRDFDTRWFNSVYEYSLAYALSTKTSN